MPTPINIEADCHQNKKKTPEEVYEIQKSIIELLNKETDSNGKKGKHYNIRHRDIQ